MCANGFATPTPPYKYTRIAEIHTVLVEVKYTQANQYEYSRRIPGSQEKFVVKLLYVKNGTKLVTNFFSVDRHELPFSTLWLRDSG